jgi:hypothetical protein
VDFEEPRIAEDRYHLAHNERQLNNSRNRPYSVAFKLRKKQRDEPTWPVAPIALYSRFLDPGEVGNIALTLPARYYSAGLHWRLGPQ